MSDDVKFSLRCVGLALAAPVAVFAFAKYVIFIGEMIL